MADGGDAPGMDPEWEAFKARARANARPVVGYSTGLGPATLRANPSDPTDLWFDVESTVDTNGNPVPAGTALGANGRPTSVNVQSYRLGDPVLGAVQAIRGDTRAQAVARNQQRETWTQAFTPFARDQASAEAQSPVWSTFQHGPADLSAAPDPHRSLADRFAFAAWAGQEQGSQWLRASPVRGIPILDHLIARDPRNPSALPEANTTASAAHLANLQEIARNDALDPSTSVGNGWADPERWMAMGATAAGSLFGGLSDPINLVMPGDSAAARIGFQSVQGAVSDAGVQWSPAAASYRRAYYDAQAGHDLTRAYAEGGTPEGDRVLSALEQEHAPNFHEFDWGELAQSAITSGLFQAGFEGVHHLSLTGAGHAWQRAHTAAMREAGRGPGGRGVGGSIVRTGAGEEFRALDPPPPSHIDNALGAFAAPFVRAATRARVASLGDPALDRIARLPDGSIDPRAIPTDIAFAQTEPWLQQLAPVVERAGTSINAEERAGVYAEALAHLQEAQARGLDPHEFADALAKARENGSLPDLTAFHTLEAIARGVAEGDLAPNKLNELSTRLTRVAQSFDPAMARMRSARGVFRDALQAAGDARPPVELGVGDIHEGMGRLVTDEERGDIDGLAERAIESRQTRTGLTLVDKIRKLGGIADEGGDVAAAVGGARARPGLISSKGKSADDLALALWEQGYFPEFNERPTPRELIDAIGEEVAGRQKRFPAEAAEDVAANSDAASLTNWLESHGISMDEIGDNLELLKREIAEKVFDATYAVPVEEPKESGHDGGGAPSGSDRTSGASTKGRASPQGWGARRGQAAGMGAGGAAVSPLSRVEAGITEIPRQTLARRVARQAQRRGVKTYIRDVIARAYTAIIESQHPLVLQQKLLIRAIENASGVHLQLKPSENGAMLARLSRDGFSPGHLDLVDGVRPYRQPYVRASTSFRDAIETATGGKEWTRDRIRSFEAYLIARRGVKAWDRYNKGELPRPPHAMTQLDLADAIRQAEMDNPQFRDGADKLYQFLAAHWQKKRDAGLITDEQYQAGLANNEDYVPFQRDMDDSGADPSRGAEQDTAPKQSGGRTNKARAFQRFRGSDRKILSPLSTIMADVYATSDRIARNESFRAFVDLAEKAEAAAPGMGEVVAKKLPIPMDQTRVDIVEEAKRAVRKAGGSVIDADAMGNQLDSLLNGDTSHVIYRPGDVVEGHRHIIYVWRDGKREAWELTDPEWSHDLFKAMTGLTQESRDLFVDLIAMPTQAIRTAIIAWPGFQIANILRDTMSSWMETNVGIKPGEAMTYGLAQAMRLDKIRADVDNAVRRATGRPVVPFNKIDLASAYNAFGSYGGGMVRAALPRSHMERDLPALRGKIFRMRNLNPVEGALTLWRGFEQATELSENASRIRLFARAFQRAKARGETDYDAGVWAAYEARDYMDFQRSGSKLLNVRRLMLFFNAALQGLDRTARTITNEGDMASTMKPLVNMMNGRARWDGMSDLERYTVGRAWRYWATFSMVGTFGLMLAALNANDPDYQYGFSDYTKNNYWLFRQGRYWMALPKPFEHAALSNALERAYEGTYGHDPGAWDRLISGMGNTYLPPTEITSAAIPLQLWANRTSTGAPIIPDGLEGLDPHLQYTAYTSQFAIDLAQALHVRGVEASPAAMDYVLGGTMGEFFRTPARTLNSDGPALNVSDFPVINRFVREPGRGATPERVAFYDNVMRANGSLNQAAGTLSDIVERGATGEMSDYLARRPTFERDFAVLQTGFDQKARYLHPMARARAVVTEIGRIRRELAGGRPLASETLFLPELTPADKRDALEALDDLASGEMQAALVMSGAPNFAGRQMIDVPAQYDRLRTVSPGVYAALRARLVTGDNKALNFETVRSLWPETQRRLESQGFRARLDDLANRGQRDFGSAAARVLELREQGGARARAIDRTRRRESFERQAYPLGDGAGGN